MFKSAFLVTIAIESYVDDGEDDDVFDTVEVEHVNITIPCQSALTLFEFTARLEEDLGAVLKRAGISDEDAEDAEVVAVEEITDMRFSMLGNEDDEDEDEDGPAPDAAPAGGSNEVH